MKKLGISVLALTSVIAVACTPEAGQTEQQRDCISRLYPNYSPRQLVQCLAACKSCLGGNTVTCSMSCKLKGAA